ncbi:MAG: hypothetical protein AVO34_12770 [Firmicutes bacterium ML8_F2]|nr:MAG: hypothetical protein AVO34_12770 [Firmicutes bacterium ML8_F2]
MIMKRFTIFLLSLFIAGNVIAQNADNKWAIGLGPGAYYNLDLESVGFLGEFYLSRFLSPTFDLMVKADAGFNDEGVDFVNPLLNLRLKLYKQDNAVQPYLFAGPGILWDNTESGVNFNAGAGIKVPVSPNTSLYLEAAYINGIEASRDLPPDWNEETVTDNFIKLNGIVEFALGAPKDSDGDGVPDKRDKCPDTPPGVQVDEDGCPLDRDGDGVPDYKDDCPDEPGDPKFNGCPDSDGDGIPDHLDECPDTPGLAKFDGCPDTDGDGVPDHLDECPDTPRGCPVDEDGCPLDSDGDGIIDCEDKCPNEPGPASNDGCPVGWETLDVPTVYFDFDKAVIKPEAQAKLDELVQRLSGAKEYEVTVGGHTCDIGTDDYNMDLSERRAEAVVKYLLSKGISNAYVSSNYYGEEKPAVPNTSIPNRQKNRRVEFEEVKVNK